MSEPPHDILAAEEFVMPAPDPDLRGPVRLPDDPTGIAEPHDILAAEEFAIPAVHPRGSQGASRASRRGTVAIADTLAIVLLRRRRRR